MITKISVMPRINPCVWRQNLDSNVQCGRSGKIIFTVYNLKIVYMSTVGITTCGSEYFKSFGKVNSVNINNLLTCNQHEIFMFDQLFC